MEKVKMKDKMTIDEAIAIAESIKDGERGIDEITLNKAEKLLADANDERAEIIHQQKVRQYRNEEWRMGCL